MERFHALLSGIRDELDGGQPGARAIASDLASALFVMMLRFHFEQEAPTNGVLALLGQRATAKVVLAMLREPERNWTLDDLAEVGAISRASLVRAFQKTCGMAPMVFLADLRMDLARRRLVTTTDPIGQIAADIGYQSEAALSRAFVRRFGIRPGAVRADSTLRR
jgi:AraC family transcriptional activator of mtrCDE